MKFQPFHFFDRTEHAGDPAGVTVSKLATLPAGDFRITEYCWGECSLWFVDDDQFTDDERQMAYRQFVALAKLNHT